MRADEKLTAFVDSHQAAALDYPAKPGRGGVIGRGLGVGMGLGVDVAVGVGLPLGVVVGVGVGFPEPEETV